MAKPIDFLADEVRVTCSNSERVTTVDARDVTWPSIACDAFSLGGHLVFDGKTGEPLTIARAKALGLMLDPAAEDIDVPD